MMVHLGKYNSLRVLKQESHGFYLVGDEKYQEIFLPNKYAPKNLIVDDELEVFVYLDSEDRIIATTLRPLATVGEFATLEVTSNEGFGVFLNWGLEKDLFVPFREQLFDMHKGQSYVVYLYIDSSGRISASTRINKFIQTTAPAFSEGDQVELLLYQKTSMGFSAIINGTHSGLIYNDTIRSDLKLGLKTSGFVKKIREDNKIDLTLYPEGLDGREDLAEQILRKLISSKGRLELNAKTSAKVIHAQFNVSKKKFKIALGYLYKKKLISIDDNGITLMNKDF